MAKLEEELRVFGQHSAVMKCEASDASMARDRAEAKLAKLSEELKGLWAEHIELQEDHSILKEDLGQLEEKHSSTLEQLSEFQASLDRAMRRKIVVEERYKHFQDEHRKAVLELKDVKAKVNDYLHQLSFTSRVRDAAWADGLHLGFKTFRTWLKDPSWKMDLDQLKVEDVPCTSDTMRRLTSLSRAEMLDATGIVVFDCHPPAKDSEVVKDAEATPTTQDPLLLSRGIFR